MKANGARMPLALNITKKKKKNVESPSKEKKESKKKVNAEICDLPEMGWKLLHNSLEITLPIKTISEANCQEHWTKRHKRHKKQKNILFWYILECKKLVKLPYTATFIRYAPKFLDAHDNLPMSMKWLCDQLCAEITGDLRPGRADDSKEITIKYDQVKCKKYAVKIIIEF